MTPFLSPLLASAGSTSENFASFDVPLWAWAALISAITAMLVIDLLLVHKTAHVISIKEAAIESAIWISIGLAFGLVMLVWHGGQAGAEYYAGFLIEKSLSVDNVFVWAVIFSFFAVPKQYQFRVLFWGIFGALVLRAVFIFAGVSLIESLRVDPLRLRRLPALHGLEDRPPRRGRSGRLQQEHRDAVGPSPGPDHRQLRRPEAVHRSRTASGWPRRCSRCWS